MFRLSPRVIITELTVAGCNTASFLYVPHECQQPRIHLANTTEHDETGEIKPCEHNWIFTELNCNVLTAGAPDCMFIMTSQHVPF